MDRLTILVSRLLKSVEPIKYFIKVPQVGCFIPLVGRISQLMESTLQIKITSPSYICKFFEEIDDYEMYNSNTVSRMR